MHRSSMMGVLLCVAVTAAAAPTYATAETLTDRVAPSTIESRAEVMAMQQALKDKGFDPGPIDGIVGPRTTAALKVQQRAENSTLIDRKGPVAALLILHMLFGDRQFPP